MCQLLSKLINSKYYDGLSEDDKLKEEYLLCSKCMGCDLAQIKINKYINKE